MITPPLDNLDPEHRGWITALDEIAELAEGRAPVRQGAGLGSRAGDAVKADG